MTRISKGFAAATVLSHLNDTVTIVPSKQDSEGNQLPDMYGEPMIVDSEEVVVPCMIDSRVTRRYDPSQRIHIPNIRVTVSYDVDINIDWLMKDGTDVQGEVIFKRGIVSGITYEKHPDEGIFAKTLTLDLA